MSFLCLLLGHEHEYDQTFNKIGRHIELKVCQRCGDAQFAFSSGIYPGEAEDPEEAAEYIRKFEDYRLQDTLWSWDDDRNAARVLYEETGYVHMRQGTSVTLVDDVPRPEDWEIADDSGYYYRHVDTDEQIIDEQYEAMVEDRNTLADFIDEISPYEE